MKKVLIILFTILFIVLLSKDKINNYIIKNSIKNETIIDKKNEYYKPYDYKFVQNTETLIPTNKQEILNIIYTTLNTGVDEATFFCDYDNCIKDINEIAENKEYLSSINNIVHPYNSYKHIYFTINKSGKIKIAIKKQYTESEILLINNKINEIINELDLDNLTDYEKIKKFHDYIINNTKYDETIKEDNLEEIETNAGKATGLLFEKKAICSGYSDTMAIFLNHYKINNYKINSKDHIWNLINIENEWTHIDATWDDPITTNGKDIIIDDFFMINTEEIQKKDIELQKNSHNYNKDIYIEAK